MDCSGFALDVALDVGWIVVALPWNVQWILDGW